MKGVMTLVLAFVGLVAIAWAIGAATGLWSMQAILSGAVGQTASGAYNYVVGGVSSWLNGVISSAVSSSVP